MVEEDRVKEIINPSSYMYLSDVEEVSIQENGTIPTLKCILTIMLLVANLANTE